MTNRIRFMVFNATFNNISAIPCDGNIMIFINVLISRREDAATLFVINNCNYHGGSRG